MLVEYMPAQINGGLPLRPAPSDQTNGVNHDQVNGSEPQNIPNPARKHKYTRSSYSESSPLVSRNNSLTFRPSKRQMSSPDKTIAVINSSGRQAASFIRVATAVGYHVRAQLRNLEGVVATEVSSNPNVTVLVGELYVRHKPSPANSDVTQNGTLSGVGVNRELISELFRGAQLAFINTTFYGDEIQIGQALADEAKKAGVQHYIYSSMPDHKAYNPAWPSLPLWAPKHEVENYVRKLELPATFVYTGIYNNNFTSLAYPLFCMELQSDGSFLWQAPFHPDAKLPWLDAEHDVGPAILQIFKDGVRKWRDKRIALAYEMLTPREACKVFAKGVRHPVRYVRGPIEVKGPIPEGYRKQLDSLERLYALGKDDPTKQPPYFGDQILEDSCPEQALALWEGPRGLEEYAREVFPLEEEANGLTWMREDDDEGTNQESAVTSGAATPLPEADDNEDEDEDDDEDNDEGLVMRAVKRDEEDWLS